MKNVIKLRSSAFSVIFILIAMLSCIGIHNVNTDNIELYVDSDCSSVANFIEKNFTTFVSEYNMNAEEKQHLNARSIEARKNVLNITNNSAAVYLDFDGSNGYVLVGNDYNLLEFSVSGDLPYLRELDLVYYSEYDGFMYLKDGEFVRYDASYLSLDNLEEYAFCYDGKASTLYSNGSDVITDIPKYVQSRYGNGWYQDNSESKTLTGYKDVYQADYAVYNASEGNCTLSAFYGVLCYLRDNGNLRYLSKMYVDIDTSKDAFASGMKITKTKQPEIYAKLRECAIKYGYTTMSTAKTSINMANGAMKH